MAKARTVVEAPLVSEIIDSYIEKSPRTAELWEALKWRLSRDPEKDAERIKNTTDTMLLKSDKLNSSYRLPTILILYSFTEDEVSFLSIKIEDPSVI